MQPGVLSPNGVNHLAISTRDIKKQIEFFTDVLGRVVARYLASGCPVCPQLTVFSGEQGLFWMHAVKNTLLCFIELTPLCSIAFQQHPNNPDAIQLGTTHPGHAGGFSTAGTMHHVALSVDTLGDLLEMRDRIRSRGVPVIGPTDHGITKSI
jgi:catechol 2,3-dioxygenase-like lactoylglutathione lyase family enzyme